jgi:putative endonuclease
MWSFFYFVMDEFVVYILFSKDHGKTYVGFTSNLIERFKSHNYFGKKGFTIKFRPWEVIYVAFFTTKSEALNREKFFKTGKGRELIKEMVSKL